MIIYFELAEIVQYECANDECECYSYAGPTMETVREQFIEIASHPHYCWRTVSDLMLAFTYVLRTQTDSLMYRLPSEHCSLLQARCNLIAVR